MSYRASLRNDPDHSSPTSILVRELVDIGLLRTGAFTLRSGRTSSLYFDLRPLVSYPAVLRRVGKAYADIIEGMSFDCLAALPMAGLPLGVAVAIEIDRPLVYPRSSKKTYGTGKSVEGVFEPGNTALVIDDVITDGGTKIEDVRTLRDVGLDVHDVVVFLDREEGGREALADAGCTLHAVTTMSALLELLGAS